MVHAPRWFVVLVLSVGYPVCLNAQVEPPARLSAERLWKEGQMAVERGDLAEAERLYRASLTADPGLARNHLSLAAVSLGRDDLAGACTHLARYLDACPEQRLVRQRYADLLVRVGRLADARGQFERCVADTQDQAGALDPQLVHCHRRLMEIAARLGDGYAEHFHRGVGVYLVARARTTLPEQDGALTAQGLFFKAAAELNLARAERAGEAQPCWYLYEVWTGLGQRGQALHSLRAADAAAPFSTLTAAEQRWLHLACQRLTWDGGDRPR